MEIVVSKNNKQFHNLFINTIIRYVRKIFNFGATGSIGSNLSKMMAENNEDVQLIGRDEENLKKISSETVFKYNVVDVLNTTKIENLKANLQMKKLKVSHIV